MKGAVRWEPLVAIDRASPTPLYRQLYDGYRDAIVSRRLRAGERLPSTRTLAQELGVSRIPVLRAFEQLLAEGYCESRAGSGTFVAGDLQLTPSVRGGAPATRPGPRAAPGAVARRAAPPGVWLRGPEPFQVGQVAAELFPLKTWRGLLLRRTRRLDPALIRCGRVVGYEPLRAAIATYLRSARAVRCETEQVMVVNGSQQALDLAARVLLEPGCRVWLEEPGYWGARDAFSAAGATLIPVPVDRDGMIVAAGVSVAPTARLAYVTPSHQFPLGSLLSAARRLELLEWARSSGAWILEDDYDSEFRYRGQPIAALQGLDRDSRVVYVGTFSKVLAPGLRVGYMVVPPDLVDRFVAARFAMDICTPPLLQAVLADFLSEGHFARHVRRTRQVYAKRRSILVDALRNELGDVLDVESEPAGHFLATTFREAVPDHEIAVRAADRGIRAMPLSTCYAGNAPRSGLVLGYAGVRPTEILGAVRRLARVVHEVVRERARTTTG